MSIFKRVNERKILHTPIEPSSTAWLWLKTENGVSTLYDFVNGKWTPVGGYTEDYEHDNHDSEWGGDQQQNTSYVTWDSLNGKVSEIYGTVETWLSGYLKEADFSNYITNDELSDAVSESMSGVLKDYQPLLRAGQSITITAVAARGLDRETDERTMNNLISVKMGAIGPSKKDPISGATAYTEFQSVYRALNNKQATLVSGTNIKTINNNSLLGGGNIAVQAPINDIATIRSGAAAGATSVQINDFTNRLSGNLKKLKVGNTTYSLVGSETINIPTSGGGTSGIPVAVIDHGDPVPAEQGVYFFAYSPLQVEGDYNNLLQNGTENGYTFSPGTLYSLGYSKRTVNGVEEGFLGFNVDDTPLDVRDNVVYVDGQATSTKYYGDVVLSNRTKYADTGTFAYISFMVACPFAASETLVTVSVDNTDKATTSLKYLYSNGDWRNLPSGGFVFRNTGGSDSITLKVERTDTHYEEKRCVIVHLCNGYSYEDIEVVFNPATVFFKNGRCMNGFNITDINSYVDSIIENNESASPDPTIDNIPTNQIVKIDGIRDNKLIIKNNYHTNACLLMTDITIDESDFNVFYVVMERKGKHSWMEVGTYLKGWAGISASESRYRMYGLSVYAPETQILREDLDTILPSRGEFIGKCYCHKRRTGGIKTVNMYFLYFDVEMVIQEFGVISYKNSTYPSSL